MRLALGLLLVVALAATSRAAEPQWSSFSGRFVFDGQPPKARPLLVDKETGETLLPNESLLVNAKNGGLANVLIWLEERPPDVHPEAEKRAVLEAKLDIELGRFVPRMLIAQAGQTIVAENRDPFTYGWRVLGQWDEILPGGGIAKHAAAEVNGPQLMTSSFHSWLRGYLLAVDHPYAACTDHDGKFAIQQLPPGKWTFRLWHERARPLENFTRAGVVEQWWRGRFTITIKPGANDVGDLKVPATEFSDVRR